MPTKLWLHNHSCIRDVTEVFSAGTAHSIIYFILYWTYRVYMERTVELPYIQNFFWILLVAIVSAVLGQSADFDDVIPIIDTSKAQHVMANRSFDLICNVTTEEYIPVLVQWNYPSNETRMRAKDSVEAFYPISGGHRYRVTQNVVTISNVSEELDRGIYTCVATLATANERKSNFSVFIKTYPADVSSHVDFKPRKPVINATKGSTLLLDVEYHAFPSLPEFTWRHNGKHLPNSARFVTGIIGNTSCLQIIDVDGSNAGNYTLEVTAGSSKATTSVILVVNELPEVEITSNSSQPYFMADWRVNFACTVTSFPPADISWLFQPCPSICSETAPLENGSWTYLPSSLSPADLDGFGRRVQSICPVSVKEMGSGFLRCKAKNNFEGLDWETAKTERILATDIAGGFGVKMTPEQPVKHEKVSMICMANHHDFFNIRWEWRPNNTVNYSALQQGDHQFQLTRYVSATAYSDTLILFTEALENATGQYRCTVVQRTSSVESFSPILNLTFQNPEAPSFSSPAVQLATPVKVNYQDTLRLDCSATGLPIPTYEWTVNDVPVQQQIPTVRFENGTAVLINERITHDEAGEFACRAHNTYGSVTKRWTVIVTGRSKADIEQMWLIAGTAVGVAAVFFVSLLCALCWRLRKMKQETVIIPLKFVQYIEE